MINFTQPANHLDNSIRLFSQGGSAPHSELMLKVILLINYLNGQICVRISVDVCKATHRIVSQDFSNIFGKIRDHWRPGRLYSNFGPSRTNITLFSSFALDMLESLVLNKRLRNTCLSQQCASGVVPCLPCPRSRRAFLKRELWRGHLLEPADRNN